MTQYDERVEQQRLRIEAQEWAKGVKSLHAHSLDSMWYDDRPGDTADGKNVIDMEFNDGSVRRTLADGETVILGTALTGEELIRTYRQFN